MLTDELRYSGRFWLAEDPNHVVAGWLGLSDRWPVLELGESLTPALKKIERAGGALDVAGVMFGPVDDDVEPERRTVHGIVRGGPGRVTLLNAWTRRRQASIGRWRSDPGMEVMSCETVVLGGHVGGEDVKYHSARLEFQELDTWAELSGLSMEFSQDGKYLSIRHEKAADQVVPVSAVGGTFTLGSTSILPALTQVGGTLSRHAYLQWDGDSPTGLTLSEIWAEIADPIRVLLTIVVDRDSPVVSLLVREGPAEQWLTVRLPDIQERADASINQNDVLMTRTHVGLAEVARWVARSRELAPVPRVVAAAASGQDGGWIESELLGLAAAAEGLHRRIAHDDLVISRSEAKRIARVCSKEAPEELAGRVRDALGHLHERSFKERLEQLLSRGQEAVPGIADDAESWIRRITRARNGFAHQLLQASSAKVDLEENYILARSLRWLLTGLLLIEAGVAAQTVSERMNGHQPYVYFRRQAQRWIPEVYGPQRPVEA